MKTSDSNTNHFPSGRCVVDEGDSTGTTDERVLVDLDAVIEGLSAGQRFESGNSVALSRSTSDTHDHGTCRHAADEECEAMRPAPTFGSARGLVHVVDDFDESVCGDLDAVLEPSSDLQDRVLEAERLRGLQCVACYGLGYFVLPAGVCAFCDGTRLEGGRLPELLSRALPDLDRNKFDDFIKAYREQEGKVGAVASKFEKPDDWFAVELPQPTTIDICYDRKLVKAVVVGEGVASDDDLHRYPSQSRATHDPKCTKWACKHCAFDGTYSYDALVERFAVVLTGIERQDNTTLNLLRDLEQRVQAVHRCGDAEQARLLLVAIKGILNGAIAEREGWA